MAAIDSEVVRFFIWWSFGAIALLSMFVLFSRLHQRLSTAFPMVLNIGMRAPNFVAQAFGSVLVLLLAALGCFPEVDTDRAARAVRRWILVSVIATFLWMIATMIIGLGFSGKPFCMGGKYGQQLL